MRIGLSKLNSRSSARKLGAIAIGLSALVFTGCPGDGPADDAGPGPAPESSGIIVVDGEEVSYTFDAERSDFVITVGLFPGLICDNLHEHAVEASSVGLLFDLDPADGANSTMTATVAATGLQPDSPENRTRYLEEGPIAPGDINSIKSSVLSNIGAEDFPTLVFSAKNFSDLTPGAAGTVEIDVDINGGNQTISLDYTFAQDGDTFTFDASGALPGAPHNIPSGFGSDCVDPDMTLFLSLVLVPGENDADIDAGVVVYNEETFPYEGDCVDKISFNTVRDVMVGRCAGCHSDPPVNGATVPLTNFDDYRVDSFRNIGEPLFETAAHFMERDVNGADGIPMPPGSASLLSVEELALALEWIAQGAPDCFDDATPVTFTTQEEATCGDVSYDDDIKPIVDNYCIGCHATGQTEIPVLESFSDGLELGIHAYYQPLVLWESSLYRILDHSMPTYATPEFPALAPAEVDLFQTWVETGYPQVHCN